MFDTLLDDPDASGVRIVFTSRAGHLVTDSEITALKDSFGLADIAQLGQIHSAISHLVTSENLMNFTKPILPEGDALVTRLRTDKPIALLVRIADCVPVVLADSKAGVVAAAHAGRRGFDKGILPSTVAAMRSVGARRIKAWIGPHICGSCYEVPQAMHDDISSRHEAVSVVTRQGTPALDLGAGCERQLQQLGLDVQRSRICTYETTDLHSYRRDGDRSGRNGMLIWLDN
ncbi:MAG: polyphenol oxidase family protein [Propionibacteriaceae bacterium]